MRAVNEFAFVNPFSPERDELEARFASITGGNPAGTWREKFEAFFRWAEALPAAKKDFHHYEGADREAMRITFLFESYHRCTGALDELIAKQIAQGERSLPVPCGPECLERMQARGFTLAEAVRYFGIFYQLRRAHYFIVRGLKGRTPCMIEFRRQLWKNVFTDDVRWYERHLWNRMEDFSTLLLGETGSGKGAAANAIGRSGFIPYLPEKREFAESFNRSFVSINLAEFPETLLEAELFGYRKGAFTGAVTAYDGVFARCSQHGAIFLDEVGEVKKDIQVKLLHVLQERTFSPVGSRERLQFRGRVIAATNRSLEELRAAKLFRDDFFYRISSDIIGVPSLRQRAAEDPSEIELLLDSILEATAGENWQELLPAVRERLAESPGRAYDWPGNVRELEQAVRRILLRGRYEPDRAPARGEDFAELREATLTADELLARYCVQAVRVWGSRAAAARRLGLDVRTLQKYLDRDPEAEGERAPNPKLDNSE